MLNVMKFLNEENISKVTKVLNEYALKIDDMHHEIIEMRKEISELRSVKKPAKTVAKVS